MQHHELFTARTAKCNGTNYQMQQLFGATKKAAPIVVGLLFWLFFAGPKTGSSDASIIKHGCVIRTLFMAFGAAVGFWGRFSRQKEHLIGKRDVSVIALKRLPPEHEPWQRDLPHFAVSNRAA